MRGGHRPGAGRPKGAKDKDTRVRLKQFPTKKEAKDKNLMQPMYLTIEKYLTKEQRKVYKDLLVSPETALDALKELRDDVAVRYKYARAHELGNGQKELKRSITELGAELRNLNELVDRIEAGRQDLRINIFNLLNAKTKEDVKKAELLRDKVFTLPDEVEKADIVITEETNKENKEDNKESKNGKEEIIVDEPNKTGENDDKILP